MVFNPFQYDASHHADVWRVEFAVPLPLMEYFSDALSEVAGSIVCEETGSQGTITLYFENNPDCKDLERRLAALANAVAIPSPNFSITLQTAIDWTSESQKHYPPLHIGGYYIHSPYSPDQAPASLYPIPLDPAASFGSSTHATTQGCLEALYTLSKQRHFSSMLDMGCGSGILAIMMAHLWKGKVVAADQDPYAVNVTADNIGHNGLGKYITPITSDGYKNPIIRKYTPYNLITANLLASLLVPFAPALKRHLTPNGIAVLSGMLYSQEQAVVAAHRQQGLRLIKRIRKDGWSTLVITH